MVYRHAYHGGTWIDLEHPTEDELHEIAREFSISERLEAELAASTPSSLVASDVGVTFLVLHFPLTGPEGTIQDQEVDFIVGSDFIITVRYEVVAPLHRLQKLLETQGIVAPNDTLMTDTLLELLFAHLFTAVRNHLEHAAGVLTHLEHEMFHGHERTTVRSISNVSREFLHIEAALANQEEPFNRFLKALHARGIFAKSFVERAERMEAERAQVAHLIATYRAIATELRETNAVLLEARQNEIMKTLTLITVLVLPLELTAVLFGVHAPGTPFVNDPNAFWIIVAFLLSLAALMALFFARKRWF